MKFYSNLDELKIKKIPCLSIKITNSKDKKINIIYKITPNSFNEIYKDISENIYFGKISNKNENFNKLICDLNDNSLEKIQFYIKFNESKIIILIFYTRISNLFFA
jgi:hypothetical protein